MSIIHKGETNVTLEFDTGLDLEAENFATLELSYIKPDGTEGSWTATIQSAPGNDGILEVAFSGTVYYDQSGRWILYFEGTTGTGLKSYGKPKEIYVPEPGEGAADQ